MNKNKKLLIGFSGGAFLFSLITIFMGFVPGLIQTIYYWNPVQEKWILDHEGKGSFYDILFKGNDAFESGFFKNRGVLVATFVVMIIVTLMLLAMFLLNLFNKSNKTLNSGLMISSIVLLAWILVICLCLNLILGLEDTETVLVRTTWAIGAGTYLMIIFSIVSIVGTSLSLSYNKKIFAKA